MTTIAYDGKVLAADQCSWSGATRRKVRKVFKVRAADGRSFLVAFSGNGGYCLAVLAWMQGKADRPNPRDFHTLEELQRQCAIVVDEAGRIWHLGTDLIYTRMHERQFAFGAGQDFAWGALEAGATAVQAVRIAIKRSDYAGIGVDTVKF